MIYLLIRWLGRIFKIKDTIRQLCVIVGVYKVEVCVTVEWSDEGRVWRQRVLVVGPLDQVAVLERHWHCCFIEVDGTVWYYLNKMTTC